MNAQYKHDKRRSRHRDNITIEHHYCIDVLMLPLTFNLLL